MPHAVLEVENAVAKYCLGQPGTYATALLEVENLTVRYCPQFAPKTLALNSVSFAIAQGEVLGLAGESGRPVFLGVAASANHREPSCGEAR